jgi:peptidoglycan/LPS O-acetylase OafA/YrhL
VWDDIATWLATLGDQYGVDPVVYAILYVGSAPFFFGSLAWLVRSLRRRTSFLLPAASVAFFFSAPTLYVFIAGRDLPVWVYGLLIGLGVFGAVTTIRSIRTRLHSAE